MQSILDCEHCQSCGRPYELVWVAPDGIWEKIVQRGEAGLRCPDCFDRECREGGVLLIWDCKIMREGADINVEETLKPERRRFHRAAARWADEMSSLEEENVRLRQEIVRLQKIEEVAKEYQLTRNINWRLELFRLVKGG